jgi:hypothetical protein
LVQQVHRCRHSRARPASTAHPACRRVIRDQCWDGIAL